MTKKSWFARHLTDLLVILAACGLSIVISCLVIRSSPVLYAVGFSDGTPVNIDLPSNYVAHFWIENGASWVAITINEKILDEWRLGLGYNEGNAGGWKEEWQIWIDKLEFHGDYCVVQFMFKDVHYA